MHTEATAVVAATAVYPPNAGRERVCYTLPC